VGSFSSILERMHSTGAAVVLNPPPPSAHLCLSFLACTTGTHADSLMHENRTFDFLAGRASFPGLTLGLVQAFSPTLARMNHPHRVRSSTIVEIRRDERRAAWGSLMGRSSSTRLPLQARRHPDNCPGHIIPPSAGACLWPAFVQLKMAKTACSCSGVNAPIKGLESIRVLFSDWSVTLGLRPQAVVNPLQPKILGTQYYYICLPRQPESAAATADLQEPNVRQHAGRERHHTTHILAGCRRRFHGTGGALGTHWWHV
jgi:hypothetical protein